MKAPLHRIAARLYAAPWLVRQDVHNSLCQQFRAAVVRRRGEDGAQASWTEQDGDYARPALRVTPDNCLGWCELSQGIAVVTVKGILGKHLDRMDTECGGYDVAVLEMQAQALQARADVHTVIVHYLTPGGAAAGVADCAQVLRELAETKRLISYVDDACSGGYWLAAAADEIYGGQSCMTGSISAVCAIDDVSAMYAEMGVKVEVFKDGALKGAGIEGTSLSEAQRADIQGRIEHIGGMFKGFIKARRPGVSDESMQGQWFYGDQAVALGLMDGMAPTLQHVIAMAAATGAR